MSYQSTKLIELGSCAFRQWRAMSHCSKIHGYQLMAKFYFGGSTLDDKNWIVDFANLKQLKVTLQQQFDHTLCVAKDDPLLEIFQHLHNTGGCDIRIMDGVGIEKTAEYCFKAAQTFIKEAYGDRCWVERVEVFEHEANSAIYSEPRPVVYSTSISSIAPSTLTAVEPTIQQNVEQLQIPLEAPTTEQPVAEQPKAGPVPLRPNVTNGYSGLFDNIRWGASR